MSGTIPGALKRELLLWVCLLALFIGGCAKRQPPTIITNDLTLSTPAPVSSASSESLEIEEPAPPPPPEKAETPAPAPAQKESHSDAHPKRTRPPSEAEAPETPEAPPAAAPALAPRKTPAQATDLRNQIGTLQDEVRQRLGKVNEARLSDSDRKTLEDARAFFAESGQALQDGDLTRALNLANKARLLLQSLEEAH